MLNASDLVCLTAFEQSRDPNIKKAVVGWLADRTSSRQAPFLCGFILNAGATALLCFATNVYLLLLSRGLQGLSAAVVYTVGFALLADTVGSNAIGEWMGYIFLCLNVGMTMAPTIGGVMYDHTGYYSIFILLFSLIVLDILMRLVMVEKRSAARWIKDDAPANTNPPAQYRTIDPVSTKNASQPENIPSPETDETLDIADTDPTTPLLKAQETDNGGEEYSPSYPPLLILLRSTRVWANLYGAFVTVTLLASFDSALPLFAERTFGWGSSGGGLLLFTITLPLLGSPLAGKLADKYPSYWLSATSFVIAGVLALLLQMVKYNNIEQVGLLCSLLALNGEVSRSHHRLPKETLLNFRRLRYNGRSIPPRSGPRPSSRCHGERATGPVWQIGRVRSSIFSIHKCQCGWRTNRTGLDQLRLRREELDSFGVKPRNSLRLSCCAGSMLL